MDHNMVINTNNAMAAMSAAFIQANLTPVQIRYMTDYVSGVSLTQIANRYGVSLSTVSRTVSVAKAKLNVLYGQQAKEV